MSDKLSGWVEMIHPNGTEKYFDDFIRQTDMVVFWEKQANQTKVFSIPIHNIAVIEYCAKEG